jgi:hypothetical protein
MGPLLACREHSTPATSATVKAFTVVELGCVGGTKQSAAYDLQRLLLLCFIANV